MLRILHLTARADTGGGPKNVWRLLSRIDKREMEFHVACPREKPYYDKYADIDDLQVHEVSLKRLTPGTWMRLHRLIVDHQIDIVHSQGKGAGLWARCLKLFHPRLKVVHHFRGIHYKHYGPIKQRIYFLIERLLSKCTSVVIHVSPSEAEEARQLRLVPEQLQRVIPNGVEVGGDRADQRDARRTLGLPEEATIVVSLVRYSVQKNLRATVQTMERLRQLGHTPLLVIVGGEDDVSESQVRQWIDQAGLADQVVLAGQQQNCAEWLSAADLYLSTARWEGLPTSVLEAMAARLPVVASRVTGNIDVVTDRTGILVDVDDIDGFAHALKRLIEEASLRDELADNACRLVESEYSVDTMVDRHVGLYRQVTGVNSQATPNSGATTATMLSGPVRASRPSRILVISDEYPPFRGGIASFASALAQQFAAVGHHVDVFCQDRSRQCCDEANPDPTGIRFVRYTLPRHPRLAKLSLCTSWVAKATRLLRRNAYDRVIVVDPANGLLMPAVRKLTGVNYDLVLHGSELLRYGGHRLVRGQLVRAIRSAEAIWCNSSYTSRMSKEFSGMPGEVVYCGADESFFQTPPDETALDQLRSRYGIGDDDLVLGTIARLDERKGQDVTLRAIADLAGGHPQLKYLIGGRGPYRQQLEALCDELGLNDRVVICGELDDDELISHYDLLDLFVMPNRQLAGTVEGFGISFIEAAARGVPSIGVNNGGVADAISRQSGHLLSSASPDELNDVLAAVVDGRMSWNRDGVRSHAEQFRWPAIASKMLGGDDSVDDVVWQRRAS